MDGNAARNIDLSDQLVSSVIKNRHRWHDAALAEMCRRSLFTFVKEFWEVVSNDAPNWNWHIPYLCGELERIVGRAAAGLPKEYDTLINIPPGTTKSTITSIMLPPWCWIRGWWWMRFISASYSSILSLEHAMDSRNVIRSKKFRRLFPEIVLIPDRDTKSNFRIQYAENMSTVKTGGGRIATSVGGTATGMHGHVLLVDDPLNPHEAQSEVEIKKANNWLDTTFSSRKVSKENTPTIMIMQRLHPDDPAGHWLRKRDGSGKKIHHICLPAELSDKVCPKSLATHYRDGLLDPERMSRTVLADMRTDIGKYGYAAQFEQNPTFPGGGMFKVDMLRVLKQRPAPVNFVQTLRYWDKAGTADGGAYTVGVKLSRLQNGSVLVEDVVRGQWSSGLREQMIRETAINDGTDIIQWIEQEPGSGGKESAENTIANLNKVGITCKAERPTGNKIFRADPLAQAIEDGKIMLLEGPWNDDYLNELRDAPFGKYKDQWDATAGAYNKVRIHRIAGKW